MTNVCSIALTTQGLLTHVCGKGGGGRYYGGEAKALTKKGFSKYYDSIIDWSSRNQSVGPTV